MKDHFSQYHPWVNFLYFCLVLGFTFVLRHPLAQLVSLGCAIGYCLQCQEKRAFLRSLIFYLPLLLVTALMNPLFSHDGDTVLLYFPSGNALTLESIFYGLSSGAMLVTVLLWFVNFNRVITEDKFLFLFGKAAPALSLILSMTLRFIPRFRVQLTAVTEAQKCIGKDISQGNLWQKTKIAVTILSILVTWALENAIETADSMKCRGYGLPGRSAFSVYRFQDRDKLALVWLVFCGFYLLSGCLVSAFAFAYYPHIQGQGLNVWTFSFQLTYLLLCSTPIFLNAMEDRKWKAIRSAM